MAEAKQGQSILDEFSVFKMMRGSWESLWRDVEELVVPMRTSDTGSTLRLTPGVERRRRVFDSTPIFANEQLASTFAAQLINPSMKWMGLQMRDKELNEDEDVTRWLADVRDLMLDTVAAPESGFHLAAHEFFLDLSGFGTSIIMVNEVLGPSGPVVFQAWPIQSVYIAENAQGKVDTVFINFRWTARQAVGFYGLSNLSTAVQALDEKTPHERINFLHVIRPRRNRDFSKSDSQNMPIESIHVEEATAHVVREGGFREMPAIVARMTKLSGETYGRGPGINMLSDIRMLQRVMEVTIRGAQKAISPPLQAPDDGLIGPLRTFPDAINFVRSTSAKDRIMPIEMGAQPSFGLEFVNSIRVQILRGFFLDPAELSPPAPRVTATAILDRRDERFRRLTPVIERLQTEWLAPLISRVFAIMMRQGLLPDAPSQVAGRLFDIKFTSPAAQAQLLTEAESMTRFLARISPVLELDPDSVVNLRSDEYIRAMARRTGVPFEIVETAPVAKQKRAAREQARARQAQAESAKLGSETRRNVAEAEESETEL